MAESGGQVREVKRLATIPRKGGREELRVSWDLWVPEVGDPHEYLSVRVWWRDRATGEWHPGKGATLRAEELAAVRDAINRANDARTEGANAEAVG